MGSRIRDNPDHVFECYCEVTIPSNFSESAWIYRKFPENFKNEEILKSVPEFAVPCEFNSTAVTLFSFVLTHSDSKWTFGFCRHAPNSPTCSVILSYLPWHETFYKILNHAAELAIDKQSGDPLEFFKAVYEAKVPEPGLELHVRFGQTEFMTECSDHHKLPKIPQNRNLTEYFSAVDTNNMITIFASMLHERRILITSKKLHRLSACVQAANSLIYPMYWQHIFIPVLPNNLLDYLCAPMPFLIGVPSSTLSRVKRFELGDIVLLDADNNKIETPFDDVNNLPSEIISYLKRNLRNPELLLGDGISRAFLNALVQLIGGYADSLKLTTSGIIFSPDLYVKTRPTMEPFLKKMLNLQIFQQFVECRVQMLSTTGKVESDEFEFELKAYESRKRNSRWTNRMSSVKREGGTFLKNITSKVKDKRISNYTDLKSKFYKGQHSKLVSEGHFNPSRHIHESSTILSNGISSSRSVKSVINGNNIISYRRKDSVKDIPKLSNLACKGEDVEDIFTEQLQPIDMDLMSDLQDLIFPKLSVNENAKLLADQGKGEHKAKYQHLEKSDTTDISKTMSKSNASSEKQPAPFAIARPPPRKSSRPETDLPRTHRRLGVKSHTLDTFLIQLGENNSNSPPSHNNGCHETRNNSVCNATSSETVASKELIDLNSSDPTSESHSNASPTQLENPIYFQFPLTPPVSPLKKQTSSPEPLLPLNIGTSTNPFLNSSDAWKNQPLSPGKLVSMMNTSTPSSIPTISGSGIHMTAGSKSTTNFGQMSVNCFSQTYTKNIPNHSGTQSASVTLSSSLLHQNSHVYHSSYNSSSKNPFVLSVNKSTNWFA